MGDPEKPGKRATVESDIFFGGNDERRLQRCQPLVSRLKLRDQTEKLFCLALILAHEASRLRNDTMIDLEVGVSLSSPALPSGTRTFSSG